MLKVPITGGPGTGKTTLVGELPGIFPDAHFVPEPAEIVISAELALAEDDPEYTPAVPWVDYSRFGPKVTAKSEELEGEIPSGAEIVFQDRSLIDTIAYCRIEGFEEYIPTVLGKVAVARYSFAFFCEQLETYSQSDVRHEDEDKASITHQQLRAAYTESGLMVVSLPAVSVEERLNIVEGHVEQLV